MKSSISLVIILTVSSLAFLSCSDSSNNLVVTSSSSRTATVSGAAVNKANYVRVLNDEGPVIGSPSSLTFKVYALYISLNADCSSLTEVGSYGSAGESKDFFDSSELFNRAAAAGTYECIAISVSDNIRFKPNAAAVTAAPAACESVDSEYTIDIYRADSGEETPWIDQENAAITATGSAGSLGDDRVVIYASTNPAAAMARATAPIHENQLGELTSPLIVPGQTIFYADGTDQIVDNGSDCGLNGVEMGFR